MKQRINVSLNPELVKEARALMKARKFDSLSEFLEALIREEWEGKSKPVAIVPPETSSPTNRLNDAAIAKIPSAQPTTYKSKHPK